MSDAAIGMLASIQNLLDIGDKTIAALDQLAETPKEEFLVDLAKVIIDSQAQIIRKLVEDAADTSDNIQKLLDTVRKL